MDKAKIYELVIKNMLKRSLSTKVVVCGIKEGVLELGVDKSTIEVVDKEGIRHYLVSVPFDLNLEGENISLNGNLRNGIAKVFISKYTYKDIVLKKEEHNNSIRLKIEKAEKSKYLLEDIVDSIRKSSDLMVEPLILADNNRYVYYIRYNLGLNNSIDIYLGSKEGKYCCRYKGDWHDFDRVKLDSVIIKMISDFKVELRKREEERIKLLSEEQKNKMIDDFVDKVWSKNIEVVVKLKTSYQCISRGMRYSVGTGKEGKFYKIGNKYKLREYIDKKGINEYFVLSRGSKMSSLTDEVLKSLPYSKIVG